MSYAGNFIRGMWVQKTCDFSSWEACWYISYTWM